ncbi:MAG: metal ABC transporter permease [Proteocatella sp.]
MELFIEMFSYPFIQRAIIVGVFVSLCAALLGVSLVLKRFAMIGDGLSHVGFGALAFAAVMNVAPLALAIPVVVIAAFLLLRISENSKIKGDSIIALISTGALAVGVMAVSLKKGVNIDLHNYMFGSILAIEKQDVILTLFLSTIVISLYLFFYSQIFSVTFDEGFAKATGINVEIYNMLIALLTAITIVLGMRLVGALLISSLIVFPSVISIKIFKSFKMVIIFSSLVSVFSFISGIFISYLYSTPTGASVVVVNIAILLFFSFIKWLTTSFKVV